MGVCFSSSPAKGEPVAQSSLLPLSQHSYADPGLAATHQFVRLLGVGISGQTAQFIDKSTHQHVAIKFVRRPVPRGYQSALLQEILVRPSSPFCIQCTPVSVHSGWFQFHGLNCLLLFRADTGRSWRATCQHSFTEGGGNTYHLASDEDRKF